MNTETRSLARLCTRKRKHFSKLLSLLVYGTYHFFFLYTNWRRKTYRTSKNKLTNHVITGTWENGFKIDKSAFFSLIHSIIKPVPVLHTINYKILARRLDQPGKTFQTRWKDGWKFWSNTEIQRNVWQCRFSKVRRRESSYRERTIQSMDIPWREEMVPKCLTTV